MEGPLATSTVAVLLFLTHLRACTIVGNALAYKYPTYADWEAVLNDPDTRRDIERFAGLLQEIRDVTALGAHYDIGEVQQAGERRDEAVEALQGLAERLGVDVEDLLSVLLHV